MRNFFTYVRVSTDKQGEGVSLQEQRDAILRYAQRNQLEVVDCFEEKETAAKRGRPVFGRMLKLLRQGKADGVIIHKIDRSARNLKDWADLGELIDQGIEVHFANESLDLHSRGGRLSADIQAVVAADYIRNLREETRKGFYGRLKQGLYPLPAPLGYLDMGKGKAKEPDPAKAPLVRKAFELYATAEFNLITLGEELHRLGLRNRNGGRIARNGLSWILNNPFYFGLVRLRRTGEMFPGIHRPLISKSLFDRVQQVLKGKFNARSQRHDFLFRRLLICKHCGYSMTGETQKGLVYYRCHTNGCLTKCIRENTVEEAVLRKLSAITFSQEEKAYLREKISQLKTEWEGKRDELAKSLALTLNQLQDRLHRLTDAYIDRSIEKDIFEERKKALLLERKDVEERLARLQEEASLIPDRLSRVFELAESASLSYKTALPDEKRDLLKTLTSNRLIDGKNVVIELRSPFREMEKRFESMNSTPERGDVRRGNNFAPCEIVSSEPGIVRAWDALFPRLIEHIILARY